MNSEKYTLIFLDTETTGIGEHDRLCQLSYKTLEDTHETMYDQLFKTPLPIKIDAMAVHHVTNQMVQEKPLFKESSDYEEIKSILEDPFAIVIAHNAPFDVAMLQKDGVNPQNVIDTLKVVRNLDPEGKIPKHKLQYLRYFLDLDKDLATKVQAHDAKGDVIILELLFLYLAKKLALQEQKEGDTLLEKMMEITSEPSRVAKFAFGKHKGKMIAQVAKEDPGYLEWLLGQKKASGENEGDWIHTLEYHLGR